MFNLLRPKRLYLTMIIYLETILCMIFYDYSGNVLTFETANRKSFYFFKTVYNTANRSRTIYDSKIIKFKPQNKDG